MIELGILGVAAAGYLGSFYVSSYLRAIGKASDDCQKGRPDLAMRRLKAAALVPPMGKLIDHWALCLNFQAYLYIQQDQILLAEQRLDQIWKRQGVADGVKCLCFLRLAEIREANGFPDEATPYRHQAYEILESETAELERRRLWSAIALTFYGTGYYARAAEALDQLLKRESSAPILHLKLLCLEYSGAGREVRLKICREALRRAKTPARRAALLASASALESPEQPESKLEAARACLEIQRKLGKKAVRENTVRALMSRLRAWKKLQRREEYFADRERLREVLDLDRTSDIISLGSVRYGEGRFEEWLELSEGHCSDPSVLELRGFYLERIGRPKEALVCFSKLHCQDSVRADKANCYLALFQRSKVEPELESMSYQKVRRFFLSNIAYIWDGNPILGAELWPYKEMSGLGLFYKGDFEKSSEALAKEVDEACWSPDHALALKKYYQACNWLYQQRWAEALAQFESLLPDFADNPVRRDCCFLFATQSRCLLGEDALAVLLAQAAYMRERYSDNLRLQADVALATLQVYFGLQRFEVVLPLLSDALQAEARAVWRGLLLDIRSKTHRSLGNLVQAETDDRVLLSLVPDSFLSEQARMRLELP